jgi:ubiquinone/menaquinone biosynthesis C-methylase UbiE
VHSSFDDQAAVYDRWFATPLGDLVDEVEKQAVFALMPEVLGQHILEMGCGTGSFALALAHRGAQMAGCDCSGPMLARAKDKVSGQGLHLPLTRGRSSHLPFRDESFDEVICILALDFMEDKKTAFQEMTRLLRPGGFLVVGMLNRFSLWTAKRTIRAWLKPSLWRQGRFITAKKLWRLLAGQPELVNIHIRQAVYFPRTKNRYFFPIINT